MGRSHTAISILTFDHCCWFSFSIPLFGSIFSEIHFFLNLFSILFFNKIILLLNLKNFLFINHTFSKKHHFKIYFLPKTHQNGVQARTTCFIIGWHLSCTHLTRTLTFYLVRKHAITLHWKFDIENNKNLKLSVLYVYK